MLTIEEKDYDLNFLIHFDMLREILIKLAKNQNALLKDVNLIKDTNKQRDYKIMKLEKIIKESENEMNEYLEPKNTYLEKEKEEEEEKVEEKKEHMEVDSQNNNININQENSNEKDEHIDTKTDEIKGNEEKKEITVNENKTEQKQIMNKEKTQRDTGDNKDVAEKKIGTRKNNFINFISGDKNNKQLLNSIKDCNSRISQLEIQLSSLIQKETGNIKKDLKNHDLENQSDFKMIDVKFNEILEKLSDYDKKIEDCTVKCASIDILNLIKDSGDGTVDAAKILFKALEDKCFKKFDIIDARYKQDSIDLLKMKKSVENFMPKLDKVNRDIESMKEIEEQQKEEINNNKKELNEQNDRNIRLLDEKNEDILKKIIEIKEEIDKDLNKKFKEIEEKMKLLGKGEDGASSLFKLGLVGNNNVDEEKLQQLDKKITDVRKKTNDLENSFKILLNEEIEILKNDVKELKFKIDKKITKEDLKELYNLHLSDLDEINDIKDQTGIINDELKKLIKDMQNMGSKIESLNGNVILLQNSQISGGRGPIIDFTKYIDQQRLTDTLRPILKEIEKIYKEMEAFQREINEIENKEKLLEKKERVNKLEEDLYAKINELKVYCNRKFSDKIETNKIIKSLEIQIKEFTGDRRKTDGDGWLMAKQPLKCFNCASCEANIKNATPTQEYIPWNKYPQGERIYRMGQGFSHMLQMMTSEFVRTFEHDTNNNSTVNFNSDSEANQNNKPNANTLLYHSSDKSFSGMKINNKEQIKEDAFNFYRTGGKVKLPKMKKNTKKGKEKFDESIPISDEEKDYVGDSVDKITSPANTESPKIMKITKKKSQNPFNMSGFTPKIIPTLDNKKKEKDYIESKGKMSKKS